MPSPIEVTATYVRERIRFRDSDVAVSDARPEGETPKETAGTTSSSSLPPTIVLKGPSDPGELVPGLTYRFFGSWRTYVPKGRDSFGGINCAPTPVEQFCFSAFVPAAPHTNHGILTYLEQAPGIGRATATLLWDLFGSAAVERLRTDPEGTCRELAFRHFPPAKAIAAAEWLSERAAYEGCSIDLLDLLKGRGFPKATFRAAVRLWGNRAADFIRRSPYRLMRFRGCGFLRCDQMYLALGGNPGARKRQALAVQHILASDSEGHTWQPIAAVEHEVRRLVSGADVDLPRAVRLAVDRRAGLVRARRDGDGRLWLAASGRADREGVVAECVGRLMRAAKEEAEIVAKVEREAAARDRAEAALAIEDEADRISRLAADAKAHAQATGRCVFCGLELTHPASIAHGYGPTCAANHGLPWDEVGEAARRTEESAFLAASVGER